MNKIVTVALIEASTTSATFSCTPTEREDLEVIGGVAYRGNVEGKGETSWFFQAVVDGVSGDVRSSLKAAVTDALRKQALPFADYDIPGKWSDIFKSNEPPAPKSLDDMSSEDQKAFNASYKALERALSKDEKTAVSHRDAAFALAKVVRDVRVQFADKERWKLFQAFAPSDVVKGYLAGKNAVSEAVKAAALLDMEGFDLGRMLPAKVSGAKGVVTAYQGVVNRVAGNVVCLLNNPPEDWGDIPDANMTAKVKFVVSEMLSEGVLSYGAPDGMVDLEGSSLKLGLLVMAAHMENWGVHPSLLVTGDDGKYKPVVGENKRPLVGPVTGLEGADEFVSAVCAALNRYETKSEAAEVADAVDETAGALVAAVKQQKRAFADWSTEDAAKHLARILMSRYPAGEEVSQEAKDAAFADIEIIIDKMSGWCDSVHAGNTTLEDILAPDTPDSEEEAEDEADAAIAG